ncbi:hypothetical protein [Variovorax sp. RO1]|nr:hypothetical protein [Variovorax sp. RO1]
MQPSTQKEAMAQPPVAAPPHRPVERCVADLANHGARRLPFVGPYA